MTGHPFRRSTRPPASRTSPVPAPAIRSSSRRSVMRRGRRYSAPSASGAPGATSSATFQVRFAGATATIHIGSAVAGTPTTVATTISVPTADTGHPIDGRVSLQVDALGEQASCLPTPLTATTASCSTTLPASLAAGTHSLTASWSTSPSFQSASVSTPLTIAAAKKSGGSGDPLPSTTPSRASPNATAAAAPAAPDPTAVALGATSTASDSAGVPLWLAIVVAIVVVAALGVAGIVTVGVVRSRRARASA